MNTENNVKLINTKEAREEIKRVFGVTITVPTMISWIQKYDLGKKMAGRWYCDSEKFKAFIQENLFMGNDD